MHYYNMSSKRREEDLDLAGLACAGIDLISSRIHSNNNNNIIHFINKMYTRVNWMMRENERDDERRTVCVCSSLKVSKVKSV